MICFCVSGVIHFVSAQQELTLAVQNTAAKLSVFQCFVLLMWNTNFLKNQIHI